MQELSVLVQKAMTNGLRPDAREQRGASFCEEMRNLKPTQWGARSPEIIDYPLVSPAFPGSPTWPFPQFRRRNNGLFLFTGTGLYDVTESGWTASAVPIYQAASQSSSATLGAGGGDIAFADFLQSWWATDGVNLMFNTPGNLSGRTFAFATAAVSCAALTKMGNRLFMGGLAGTNFSTDQWTELFALWRETSPASVFTATNESFGTNYLLWSEESGGDTDLPFETLKFLLGVSMGSTTIDSYLYPAIRELFETGRIGLMPVEGVGSIEALMPMGGKLVVYGKRGVAVVAAGQNGYSAQMVDGAAGIIGGGAVNGDDNEHIWLGNDGDLWRFGSEGVGRLGYREFLGALSAATVISFDPFQGDHWISDGVACYVRTRTGLGGPMSVLPSSVARSPYSDALIGTAPDVDFSAPVPGGSPSDLDSTDSDIVLVRTVPFDLGQRGQKHVTAMQVACDGLRDARATAHYRYSQQNAYVRRRQSKVTLDGFARIDVNGLDFKVEVLGVAATEAAKIDYVDVRYQKDDRREIRGTQGTPEAI